MPVDTFARFRQQGEMVLEFMHLVTRLVNRGFSVEIRPVLRASFQATVRNTLERVVGDLQYRDPIDEQTPEAVGISYSCHLYDPQYYPDTVFQTVVATLGRKHASAR